MNLKGLVEEDIVNYKKTSMFIITSRCSLKCDKENGNNYCHNSGLLQNPDIQITGERLYKKYESNPLSHAVVIGGLEPFDTYQDLLEILECFRIKHGCKDDIVIYTGYDESELNNVMSDLSKYFPLIIKFGRFRPNQESHFDELLGVSLSNDEQHAKLFN